MEQREQRIELLRKYYRNIRTAEGFYVAGEIPEKRIANALKTFASGIDPTTVIGFYDTSISGSGKSGFVFTDTKVCYSEFLEKTKKLWYEDIRYVQLEERGSKDSENWLQFYLNDGSTIEWTNYFLNKTPLLHFFNEIIKLVDNSMDGTIGKTGFDSSNSIGAIAGGLALGNYNEVNKLYDEEKFHSRQGHGFAAERANTLYDNLTGHNARIVGDDNAKNGADRIVDGIFIQSKYCQTGKACIDECIDESGNFRYLRDGAPMQIEVPYDKYEAAVEAMKDKIRAGKVPGISDPADAENLVRRGHFTYEQAKNIAKAGNVDSLKYDALNGVIIATSAFGVTAVITLATNLWDGKDFEKSLKIATYSGLKVGGTAFVTTILASQLSKAGLNSALVGSSEAIIAIMGPKASAVLINAFRSGTKIYGAAAMKSAAKLLRGNAITAGITVVVLSSFDIANIFRGRISGKQLFKNMANTATTVAAGTAGWVAGAAIGTAIFPGVGTGIGIACGLFGSIITGTAAGKATDVVLGAFIEDDAEEMVRVIEKVFSALAVDYLLSEKEAEKMVDNLREILDGNKLKDMFASKDRTQYAEDLLTPLIENELKNRRHIRAITNEEMVTSLRQVLEEISDAVEYETAPA